MVFPQRSGRHWLCCGEKTSQILGTEYNTSLFLNHTTCPEYIGEGAFRIATQGSWPRRLDVVICSEDHRCIGKGRGYVPSLCPEGFTLERMPPLLSFHCSKQVMLQTCPLECQGIAALLCIQKEKQLITW